MRPRNCSIPMPPGGVWRPSFVIGMGKRNKIRYQSKPKPRVTLALSGKVYLRYVDDEAIAAAGKGDAMVYPYNEALNSLRQGDYGSTGFAGYFKVDVHDGREWRLVLLNDIFPHRENHFSKSEYPIDTYRLCREILEGMQGKTLLRTYREHYAPEGAAESEDD
jgi:hypothetical protein